MYSHSQDTRQRIYFQNILFLCSFFSFFTIALQSLCLSFFEIQHSLKLVVSKTQSLLSCHVSCYYRTIIVVLDSVMVFYHISCICYVPIITINIYSNASITEFLNIFSSTLRIATQQPKHCQISNFLFLFKKVRHYIQIQYTVV